MNKLYYALTGVFLLLYAACKHDPVGPDPQPVTTATTSTTATTANTSTTSSTTSANDSVCFNTEILPLFQSNCAQSGCHDAISHQEGYTFTSYSGIMKGINDGEIMDEIEDNNMPMAPVPPLTSAQKTLLRKWINEGARNRTCNDPCDPSNATFAAGVNAIITTNCTGCHNGNVANGGINLQGYDNVKAVALSGKLMCVIRHEAGCVAMPYNGEKLGDNCITLIRNWIDNGTPNN